MGDVHQLHPAVRHRHDALPEDAPPEHEIVVAQLISERAGLSRSDQKPDQRHEGDDPRGIHCHHTPVMTCAVTATAITMAMTAPCVMSWTRTYARAS